MSVTEEVVMFTLEADELSVNFDLSTLIYK